MMQDQKESGKMDRFVADIHERMRALVSTVDGDMSIFNAAMSEQKESLRQLDRKMAATDRSMKAYGCTLARADAKLERTGLLARKLEKLMTEYGA